MLIAGAALSDVLATNTGYYVSGDKKFSVECSLVGAGALRYSPKAPKYKYVGQVVVAFSIGTDGKVVDPHILDSEPPGVFVMLTDGVTDVMNELPRPIAFGRKRLMRLLEDLDTSDPQLVISRVMEAIDHYKGSTPLRDDLTLLAFYLDELMSTGVDEAACGVANS